ncbi:MAG: EpsG family protein [Lachnospiraceae bacterium]|nr:EpsG family protein [Lachnospiraceae bacterium]
MGATVYLYVAIILLATMFARLAVTTRMSFGRVDFELNKGTDGELNGICVFLSFMTLFLFTALSTSGTDYSSYERWFNQSVTYSWQEIFDSEWLYYIFNRVVHYFTSDFRIYIAVYSAVLLLLIYSGLVYLSDKIDFSWAVFVYAALFYLPMFNTKRICLAAALLFFAVRFLMEKRYFVYLLFIVLASGIHTASIFWLLFLLSYIFINERTYRDHKILVILAYVALAVALIATRNYWLNIEISKRYEQYTTTFTGIGIGIILKYTVLIFLIVRWMNLSNFYYPDNAQETRTSAVWRMALISTGVSLVFSFSGYVNQVFSRMQTYTMYSYVVFLPFLIREWKTQDYDGELSSEVSITKAVIVLYVIFLFFDFANNQMSTSGLDIYTTIWGWSLGN